MNKPKGNHEEIKKVESYGFTSPEVIAKLVRLKEQLKSQTQKDIDYTELIFFLRHICNFDDLQIKQLLNPEMDFEQLLIELFKTKSTDDIINMYKNMNLDGKNIKDLNSNQKQKKINSITQN